jgi:hypothetical protein
MAEHGSTSSVVGPETPEAFMLDRQRFWNGFTHAITGSVIAVVVVLIAMAIFLL